MPLVSRLLTAGLTLAGMLAAPVPAAAAAPVPFDRTGAAERSRVDAVRTPHLGRPPRWRSTGSTSSA